MHLAFVPASLMLCCACCLLLLCVLAIRAAALAKLGGVVQAGRQRALNNAAGQCDAAHAHAWSSCSQPWERATGAPAVAVSTRMSLMPCLMVDACFSCVL